MKAAGLIEMMGTRTLRPRTAVRRRKRPQNPPEIGT